MDLALPSLLLYLAGYTVTNIAAFAVTCALPRRRELAAYRGLLREQPWLAVALAVALLGLVGTPPTAVFVGKLTTATAAWDGGMAWLAVALLVNSLVSLFYYLRWIAPAFGPAEGGGDTSPPSDPAEVTLRWSARTAQGAALLSIALGLGAGLVWQVID